MDLKCRKLEAKNKARRPREGTRGRKTRARERGARG